jgi:excisionase family DNA binding protein
MQDQVLTLEEAADRAKVRVKSMREWLRTGKLKGIKAGRLWRVRASDLEAFFEASVQRPRLVLTVVGGEHDSQSVPVVETPDEDHPLAMPVAPTLQHPAQRKAELLARLRTLQAEGHSLQTIADQMNAEGVPTLTGRGRWQKGTVGKLLAQEEVVSQ